MTENYYLAQKLLLGYFKNPKNKEFFYNVIGSNTANLKIFFEKELYGWVKEDFFKSTASEKDAEITEEDKTWKYNPIEFFHDLSDNKKWITIFAKFPHDFVGKNLDSISVAIAMKGNPQEGLEIRLFYLEIGESYIDKQKCVFVCENSIEKNEHLNYGKIEFNEHFMANFREKIQTLLNED